VLAPNVTTKVVSSYSFEVYEINIQILNTIDGKKEKKMEGKNSVNCWNGKLCTYSSHFDFQNNFKRAGNFFFSIL
jgi:hypothetical protein